MARFTQSGGGIEDLVVPVTIKDDNSDPFITFTRTGTGTARIESPQDDLSLRSPADITLFAGTDGPGNVYIGWGDAEYTPNATNRVATIQDINDATGLNEVKYVLWQYPTTGAIAIQNATDGEAISLKSSTSAAVRWHIRDGGPFVNGATVNANSIIQQNGEMGVGPYQVQFSIDEQDSVLPVGYYYQINQQGPWAGAYVATAATINTLTLEYPGPNVPGANEDFTGATVGLPSVYSQVEANEDGIWIKNANWSSGPDSYSNYWHFTNDGSIHFPYGVSNARTGYGDVLRFATSIDQAIIAGPKPTSSNPTAPRMVVAGADGYTGTSGEGGDIYLWAGVGGSADGSGGDIKLDGGNGSGVGEGGTVKMRGGYSPTGTGGFVTIEGGNGGTAGGPVGIYSYNTAPITLSGAGGEFLNDSSNPNNQIATIGDLVPGAQGPQGDPGSAGADGLTFTPLSATSNPTATDATVGTTNFNVFSTTATSAFADATGTLVRVADKTSGSTLAYVGNLHTQYAGGFGINYQLSEILEVHGTPVASTSTSWEISLVGYQGVSGDTYDILYTTHNGDGTNIKIGDDAWIGDVNEANQIGIIGVEDATKGGIVFGNTFNEKVYSNATDLVLESGNDIVLYPGSNYAYLNDVVDSQRIATLGDISTTSTTSLQSTRWTPNFTATGLAFTGSGATHPAYNSYYVKQGQLVSFWIAIDLATVTNFGTGQLKVDLPFAPLAGTMNHFSGWVFVDETANPDNAGHIIVNADHLPNTQTLDLHYIKQSGGANSPVMEAMLIQGTPVTLTTLTNIYINGTYISAS